MDSPQIFLAKQLVLKVSFILVFIRKGKMLQKLPETYIHATLGVNKKKKTIAEKL